MTSHSSSHEIPFGAAKLWQDMAALINNSQGSDVQFKVGGGISTQENGETIYDESATVTLYAHSLILRCRSPYFVTLLDDDNDWKEKSKCIIYKPEISPTTLQHILRYIYTGDIRTKISDNIVELITTANEMGLEELSFKCQDELIHIIRRIFSDEGERSIVPIDAAIHTHIIPALNFASNHSPSDLSKELFAIILPRMSAIIRPPDAYTTFINKISSEALIKVISSDDLAMTEDSVWDLTLSWACHQIELSKAAVKVCLNNPNDDEEDRGGPSDGVTVNDTQLKQLKNVLAPLLPAIRFKLLEPGDYQHIINILIYMLPRRRYLEINQFFMNMDGARLSDTPRKIYTVVESRIAVGYAGWERLRKKIFETGGIAGCHSLNDLKFELLFRASDHGFRAHTFHQLCDNKGPTLVIVRSSDGHIFGGVNFNHWKSEQSYSSSVLNFLFALPDERHRKDSAIFKTQKNLAQYSSFNYLPYGPTFGAPRYDLHISDSANNNQNSFSNLPNYCNGSEASKTALAGSHKFKVSDYEVFVISK